jgi:hypothetical protein
MASSLARVKTGVPNFGTEVDECKKDAWLMQNGKVAGAHWHFFPHARFNSVGPTQAVLDCLIANGIRFTVHAPNV